MDKSTLFSGQSRSYSLARPGYPAGLFDFILSHVGRRDTAWDCATGNGQTAASLSPYFRVVIATDISKSQIDHALRFPNIDYRVSPAEHSGIDPGTVDLVTVSQAMHWFDPAAFHREVKRVCAGRAVVAVWYYGIQRINEIIDGICFKLTSKILAGYWPKEVNHIYDGYRQLPFPYKTLPVPSFTMSEQWDLERFTLYLRSFSAAQRFFETTGSDPLESIEAELTSAWGSPDSLHTVEWPLGLKIGLVHAGGCPH